jgi:hypothetical protein
LTASRGPAAPGTDGSRVMKVVIRTI